METDLRVYLMGRKGAEKWTRHCYNVPANVGLGWTPYRVLVMSGCGTMAHTAFETFAQFKRWLAAKGYTLRLNKFSGGNTAWVMRSGSIYS